MASQDDYHEKLKLDGGGDPPGEGLPGEDPFETPGYVYDPGLPIDGLPIDVSGDPGLPIDVSGDPSATAGIDDDGDYTERPPLDAEMGGQAQRLRRKANEP